MIYWILSVILYIGTIIVGLYIDRKNHIRYSTERKLYELWLYIFLCFGYMVGTDWRMYEIQYVDGMGLARFELELGSLFLFKFFPTVIPDYWVFIAILKIIYLYCTKKFVSLLTERWLSVLAILIPLQFALMLIEHPLRFTIAVTILIYAIYFIYGYISGENKSYKRLLTIPLCVLLAVSFHNSVIVYLFLIPLFFLVNKIANVNSAILFILYIFFVILTSEMSLIIDLKRNIIIYIRQYLEIGEYKTYEYEEEYSLFTLYNFVRISIFSLVLLSKKVIVSKFTNGTTIYGFTIIYLFLQSLFSLIPTGFRLLVPLSVFYGVYIIYMLQTVRLYSLLLTSYIFLSFVKLLWTNYDFIPYSNSIPYMIVGHKPYNERFNYNLKEYKLRTGDTHEIIKDVNYR